MSIKNYLVIDFGASNGRVVIGRFDGKRFDIEVIHKFDNRPVFASATLYWDILRLYSELEIGIMVACRKYNKVSSLSLDSWGLDFGLIDANGKLTSNPVHYRDKGKDNTAFDRFFKKISKEDFFSLTGWVPATAAPLFYLYLLRLRKAYELESAKKFLMIPDIFNYFLTGNICNEFTIASNSLMLNWENKSWENKILENIGISRDLFSDIVMPGTKIGNISHNVSSRIEIKTIPVIASASHDTASAVAGIPATIKGKNWAFVSMGTWFVVGIETGSPLINYDIVRYGFTNEGGAEGKSFLAKNVTGLWIVQQCREKWIRDKGRDVSWDEIVNLSNQAEPFNSFINIDEPIFAQTQVDMPKVIFNYCKQKGEIIPQTIEEISRCIYESLAMEIRYYLELIEKLVQKKIELIYLISGGIQNKILCQWISDITGIEVIAGPVEATSVGNLLMQLKAAGEIRNLEEGREISLNSSEVIYYEPRDRDSCEDAYNRYLKVL